MGGVTQPTVVYLDVGPWYGGAQRSLVTLAAAMRAHGCQPLIIGAADALTREARAAG